MRYDLAVIGGGIIGAGVARDATLRGLKVALLEKEDFGSGTTSRSTRLIHGGLRYLSKYDFALVHEALTERRALLKNAPHLVRPQPFLLPVYRGHGHPLPILWAGVTLYDYLDLRRTLPHHRFLPRSEMLRWEPALRQEGLRGGFLYYDAQCCFPERLCLENALDAAAHGARIENHARVVGLERKGGDVTGLRYQDALAGVERRVDASLVLNCSGPWLDDVERLCEPTAEAQLRRTKGVHLVLRKFTTHAVIFETRENDRVVFAIPWGPYELVGTTDTDYAEANEAVSTTQEDVEYVLRELGAVMHHRFRREDILFTTAGLRPLMRQTGRTTADITRRHKVIDHEATDGARGYMTVVGGKITTFRHIAEEVVDAVVAKLGLDARACRTLRTPLPGGRIGSMWPRFVERVLGHAQRLGVPHDSARHLVDQYGLVALDILGRVAADPSCGGRIDPKGPWIWAEADHAVHAERAGTLADVMLRRLMAGLSAGQGRSVGRAVATRMSSPLGWDPQRLAREIAEYEAILDRNWTPQEAVNP